MKPEFVPNLLDVALGRAFADEEPIRDLPVRHALGDQDGDLPLTTGECDRSLHLSQLDLPGWIKHDYTFMKGTKKTKGASADHACSQSTLVLTD
jgi:hypothetical protein